MRRINQSLCIKFSKILISILLISIVGAIIGIQINRAMKYHSYGAWGIFHYYLGSKYLKEVGYFDLYSCAIETHASAWKTTTVVRDLRTYELVSVQKLAKCPRSNFSTARWKEFVHDVIVLTNPLQPSYWAYMLTDKGFNPPPSASAVAGFIANSISLDQHAVYAVLFNLDILFIILTSIMIWYYMGFTPSLITLILSFVYFGTFLIVSNNYFQYTWYPFLAGSLITWKKNKYSLSGILLGCAAALQGFPVFFAVPIFLVWMIDVIRHQVVQAKNSGLFIRSFLITICISVIMGVLYTGRLGIWNEWTTKMNLHKTYINNEIFNIGLPNLISTTISTPHTDSYSYYDDFARTKTRMDTSRRYREEIILIQIIAFAGILYVLKTIPHRHVLVVGFFIIFIFISLSPYYYIILALLPVSFWDSSKIMKRFVIWSTCILFAVHLIFLKKNYVSFTYTFHTMSKLSILILYSTLVFFLISESKKTSTPS